jgi:hypothetical protein
VEGFSESISADDDAALSAFVPKNDEAQGVHFLKPLMRLDENFATEPVRDHIHIIVQRPPKFVRALLHYLT